MGFFNFEDNWVTSQAAKRVGDRDKRVLNQIENEKKLIRIEKYGPYFIILLVVLLVGLILAGLGFWKQ